MKKVLHLIDLALSEKTHLQEAVDFPVRHRAVCSGGEGGPCVLAEIPVDKLAKVGGGIIEFVTIVFNEKNDIVLLQRKELSRWPASSMQAFAKSLISLPPGRYECRVVLRNMTTGQGARGSSQIVIPEKPEAGLLSPIHPLLLKPRKEAIFLGEEEGQKEMPLMDIYPFDPEGFRPNYKASSAGWIRRSVPSFPFQWKKAGKAIKYFQPFLINPAPEEKEELPILGFEP